MMVLCNIYSRGAKGEEEMGANRPTFVVCKNGCMLFTQACVCYTGL